ncbi:MAG: HNH endonuclease signature motif containing protein [Microbacteriaceae bacterium]
MMVAVPVVTLLGTTMPDTGGAAAPAAGKPAVRPADYRANPAVLNGFGPIDADTARRLSAKAPSLFRLLTDPIDGAILTVDRKRHRPPADLKRLVHALRPTCSFPGCNRLAEDCDIDHSLDWVLDGRTALHNLAPACRHHHRIKHKTRWRMTRDPNTSDITWISSRGTNHETDPPPF